MKFQGKELVEYKPTEIVFFNPPKKMLVWDSNSNEPTENDVVAFIPSRENFPVVAVKHTWMHCAEISEPELATVRQLAKWVRKNGEVRYEFLPMGTVLITSDLHYEPGEEDKEVSCMEKRKHNAVKVYVRKWSETEWHSPTREYLGLEDK